LAQATCAAGFGAFIGKRPARRETAGEKLVHLGVLSNDFLEVYVFFHGGGLYRGVGG
jgi:hypothetical protein